MGNKYSDSLQIETNCRVAGYMRMFYSAYRQPKWVCKYRKEKKIAFLSFMTSLVTILEKLPFHMAVQSYLYFRYRYINTSK